MIHNLKPEDYPKRYDLSIYGKCVPYGSVGKLTGKTLRFLGTERPDFSCSLDRHNTKVTACRIAFFMIASSNHSSSMRLQSSGCNYLDMLENYALP
jgi:hypothetical protein